MAWDGFIKGELTCRNCGKVLGNQNRGNPAESYLATYTGICYECQRIGKTLIYTYPLDGCKLWSYPPHAPAWRRNRETYRAYDDCPECKGNGYKRVSRSLSQGGDYNKSCPTCFDRFWGNPRRIAASNFREERLKGLREKHNQNFIEEALATIKGLEVVKPVGRNGRELKRIPKGWKPQAYIPFPKGDPREVSISALVDKHFSLYEVERSKLDQEWEELFPDVVSDYRIPEHPLK